MRVRCAEGFAPPRYQGRTPRYETAGRTAGVVTSSRRATQFPQHPRVEPEPSSCLRAAACPPTRSGRRTSGRGTPSPTPLRLASRLRLSAGPLCTRKEQPMKRTLLVIVLWLAICALARGQSCNGGQAGVTYYQLAPVQPAPITYVFAVPPVIEYAQPSWQPPIAVAVSSGSWQPAYTLPRVHYVKQPAVYCRVPLPTASARQPATFASGYSGGYATGWSAACTT